MHRFAYLSIPQHLQKSVFQVSTWTRFLSRRYLMTVNQFGLMWFSEMYTYLWILCNQPITHALWTNVEYMVQCGYKEPIYKGFSLWSDGLGMQRYPHPSHPEHTASYSPLILALSWFKCFSVVPHESPWKASLPV